MSKLSHDMKVASDSISKTLKEMTEGFRDVSDAMADVGFLVGKLGEFFKTYERLENMTIKDAAYIVYSHLIYDTDEVTNSIEYQGFHLAPRNVQEKHKLDPGPVLEVVLEFQKNFNQAVNDLIYVIEREKDNDDE